MQNFTLSRRNWLSRMGGGFGTLGLASLLGEAGLANEILPCPRLSAPASSLAFRVSVP